MDDYKDKQYCPEGQDSQAAGKDAAVRTGVLPGQISVFERLRDNNASDLNDLYYKEHKNTQSICGGWGNAKAYRPELHPGLFYFEIEYAHNVDNAYCYRSRGYCSLRAAERAFNKFNYMRDQLIMRAIKYICDLELIKPYSVTIKDIDIFGIIKQDLPGKRPLIHYYDELEKVQQ